MNRVRKRLTSALLACIVWMAGIHPVWSASGAEAAGEAMEVRQVIERKEQAVNGRNLPVFLSVLNQGLPFYVEEQKRWFQDAVRIIDPGSFRLRVMHARKIGASAWRLDVRQSWARGGKVRSVTVPLVVKKTSKGWKDSDLAFFEIGTGSLRIRYSHPALRPRAEQAFSVLAKAVKAFCVRFGWTPKRVEVKLYHRPDVFRQSVKLSLPEWAGGWHEANQSIKLVAGSPDDESWFAPALVHELTHQMVSELTRDNAAYWLQEGAAMYYEAHLLPGIRSGHSLKLLEKTGSMSLEELKRSRLEKLNDLQAFRYYLSAYLWFRSETEKRGEQAWIAVFSRLRRHPFLDLDGDEKSGITNRLTDEALKDAWEDRGKSPRFSLLQQTP